MSSTRTAESTFREWLLTYDPNDADPARLTSRFVAGIRSLGICVHRASLWLPTAHPELWGTQVVWKESEGCQVIPRQHTVTQTSTFLNTPGEAVHASRTALRFRLDAPVEQLPYPLLAELSSEGATDYLIVPFHTDHAHEQPWIAFATREPSGFSEIETEHMLELCVLMGWKARVAIAEQATRSLLRVYLGRNAAERVWGGEFRRGSGQRFQSVIWFCDLRGFTKLGDAMPASELVSLLDEYFELVAGPIEDAGGEILKFVGDAVMAVFPCSDDTRAVAAKALGAARQALSALAAWSEHQRERARPELAMGVSLHVGEVFYGNIGGRSRLDFTVIGAAVNEAARVESLCKDVGVPLLVTRPFADTAGHTGLVSVGKHNLRGVRDEQELFTLLELLEKPARPAPSS